MSLFHSLTLRSRIAATVFLLSTFMLVSVLVITLAFLERNEIKNTDDQHQAIFQLLQNLSQTALFAQQYDQLQQTIEQLSKDPQILDVQLLNKNSIVVVASDFSHVGSSYKSEYIDPDSRVYSADLDGLGLLYATFSYQQITETVNNARDIGLSITFFGVSLITLISYGIAYILTRRLNTLTSAVVEFDASKIINKATLKETDDEVGRLTGAFIQMASNIVSNLSELQAKQEELNKLNQKLQQLSELDTLTQIANRRKFESRFEYEINTAIRNRDVLSVIMLDVDYFKKYNDTYGHLAGDRILQLIAQTIAENLPRKTDFVARYGGEEFIVLLPSTDGDGAFHVGESIRTHIQKLNIEHTGSKKYGVVTISLGIDVFHTEGDQDLTVSNADKALYAAKVSGRNCTKTYDSG